MFNGAAPPGSHLIPALLGTHSAYSFRRCGIFPILDEFTCSPYFCQGNLSLCKCNAIMAIFEIDKRPVSNQNDDNTLERVGCAMAEVWEDLQCAGLGIYRASDGFSYGHDAVLLANFIRAHRGQRLLDLGTGTGIIALLAHAKTGAIVDAVDLSQASCALAAKSVARNGLAHAISVQQADLRLLPDARLTRESFDCVACNPPYYASGTESADPARRQSTHETTCTIHDVASCAHRMLKNGGKLFVCYPAAGLSRLCAALEARTLAVKRICMIRAKRGRPPYLILVEAKKGGGSGVTFEEDIILEEI